MSSAYIHSCPTPFLQVIVHDIDSIPGLSGLCAGYELGEWRCEAFADHIMEWLPDFCLNWRELRELGAHNSVALLRKAARRVYTSDKFKKRGEFGEILLHACLRHLFKTVPAISKIYYKDSNNDTVKGFDAVHVVANEEERRLELWIGEVKFYNDIKNAIRDVVEELNEHTQRDYLRDEFLAITNKLDADWPWYEQLSRLLDPKTSLDTIFDAACIPVLLTYDSTTTFQHANLDEAYRATIESEFKAQHQAFAGKDLPKRIRIHLILVPLNTKDLLIKQLDSKLKTWQQI